MHWVRWNPMQNEGWSEGNKNTRNALICIFVNDLQDINIGNRGSPARADSPKNIQTDKAYRGRQFGLPQRDPNGEGLQRSPLGHLQTDQDMGGQVRKGEKATHALFYKFDDEKEKQQPGAPADSGLYATPLSQRSRRSRASTTADRIASPHGNITHPPQPAKIQPA